MVNGVSEVVKTLESNFTGPQPGAYATKRGDSGSLLFLSYDAAAGGQVVGMLLGGTEVNDICYFTRIDHLLEDIKAHTRAKDIRMYDA